MLLRRRGDGSYIELSCDLRSRRSVADRVMEDGVLGVDGVCLGLGVAGVELDKTPDVRSAHLSPQVKERGAEKVIPA